MRYLAILKDSLREALDSKVLFVLVALSTLIIVLVATISFKPLSAERTMEQFFLTGKGIPLKIVFDSHKPEKMHEQRLEKTLNSMGQSRLVKTELVRGERDAPDNDYALTVSMQTWRAANPQKDAEDAAKGVREIFQEAEDLGYFKIGSIEALPTDNKAGGAKLFRVTLHGTPSTFRIWASRPSILFGAYPIESFDAPMGYQLYILTQAVLSLGSWVAVLVGVVITSFFIPNMLRKGTVDLMLVKPIHRWVLLLYKYIGGLTFIFLSTAYAVGGIWLVLGLRTGLWANGSLLLILSITFFFAILYAISTLVAVLTRSTVTAIMLTIGAWFGLFVIGVIHGGFEMRQQIEKSKEKNNQPIPEDERWGDSTLAKVANVIYAIVPRTTDLNQLNELIVFCDFMTGNMADMNKFDTSKRNWWECLLVSTIWISVFLGLAMVWFTFKDY